MIRAIIRRITARRDPMPGVPSDELRRLYWEQRDLAERSAADGYLASSRSQHRSAAVYADALRRRGEPTIAPAPTTTPTED